MEELVAGHAVGGFVGASGDAAGVWGMAVAFGIAEVASGGFLGMGGGGGEGMGMGGLVGHHEDAPVGAIIGAEPATDAVIFDDDLEVFATVDGIDGATDEAMGIGAGAAVGGDELVIEADAIAEQASEWGAVGGVAVLIDAAFGAFVAAGAEVEIEDEDAAAFVEALGDIFLGEGILFLVALESGEGLVGEAASEEGEALDEFEEILAMEAGEFHGAEGGAGGGAAAGGDAIFDGEGGIFEGLSDGAIGILEGFLVIGAGKGEETDFAEDGAWAAGEDARFVAELADGDADVAEANEVEMIDGIALAEEDLAGVDANEMDTMAEEIDDFFKGSGFDALEEFAGLEDEIEGAFAVFFFEAGALAGEAHEAIEDIAADFPDFGGFEGGEIGGAWGATDGTTSGWPFHACRNARAASSDSSNEPASGAGNLSTLCPNTPRSPASAVARATLSSK